MENQSVTPLETIRLASLGNLVDIPGFGDGETITVRLRKPNMLTLMKIGKIPNELMGVATELFEGKNMDIKDLSTEKLSKICEIMMAFCEASLAEPSYKQLTESDIELTMDQMTFIFNYAVGRVKLLKPFRSEREHSDGVGDGGEVENTSELAAGD